MCDIPVIDLFFIDANSGSSLIRIPLLYASFSTTRISQQNVVGGCS